MYQLKSGASREVTLRQIWADYKEIRGLKRNTVISYEVHMRNYLPEWEDIPISSIHKSAVLMKYGELCERFTPSTANGSLRIARSLIAFGITLYDLSIENPVQVLTQLKVWRKENYRRGQIPSSKFQDWHESVDRYPNPTARDYLKFLALTGLRRQEAADLKWGNVNFDSATFIVYDTKNGGDLELPLSNYCLGILRDRANRAQGSPFVFSSEDLGSAFNLSTFCVQKIGIEIGLKWTPHDLRRTFLTIGDELDVPLHVLKRLANHSQMNSDITMRYIQASVDRLREPSERIASHIVKLWSQPHSDLKGNRL